MEPCLTLIYLEFDAKHVHAHADMRFRLENVRQSMKEEEEMSGENIDVKSILCRMRNAQPSIGN